MLYANSIIDFAVDDVFDDDSNELKHCWFYYDDNSGFGAWERPQCDNPGIPSVVNVPYVIIPRNALGNTADTVSIKKYIFTPSKKDDNSFASLPFTMGNTWKPVGFPYTMSPQVGIGTNISSKGEGFNLLNIEYVKFKARSRNRNLKVRFKVGTLDIDNYSLVPDPPVYAIAYPETLVNVTTSWSEIIVDLKKMSIPSWANEMPTQNIDWSLCTKIIWEVSQVENEDILTDTLDIDDIYLTNGWVVNNRIRAECKKENIRIEYVKIKNKIKISWDNLELLSGKIKLNNMSGKTVYSTCLKKECGKSPTLPLKYISDGIYIVSLDAIDKTGKYIKQNQTINIVR